jgi:hypothetical protein
MLDDADLAWIRSTGRDATAAAAQLAVLHGPAPTLRVDRPATLGDGVRAWSPAELDRWAGVGARALGRASWFVPASGAASRMCEALLRAWQDAPLHGAQAEVVRAALEGMPHAALWPSLVAHGAREGDSRSVLAAMFGPGGLSLDAWTKGLVPFHLGPEGPRSAAVEHLDEAAQLVAAEGGGTVRLHFTLSPEHLAAFAGHVEAHQRAVEARHGVALDVSWSAQDPRTDTIAGDGGGGPFRDASGHPVFRPGGHGALLRNLSAWAGSGADLVFVRNVDNVSRPGPRATARRVRLAMLGLAVDLQAEVRRWLAALDAGEPCEPARAFARDVFGADPGGARADIRERLDRPLRVAGMVRNEGQPGGGPFWAASPDGVALQIVELAQVGSDQAAVAARSTHFNPVDMVLALTRPSGEPYDLDRYTDPAACFVTHRSQGGRPLRTLEHPGLWNGQMARWNSVFVEIPTSMFHPVKTLADLVGPAHGS